MLQSIKVRRRLIEKREKYMHKFVKKVTAILCAVCVMVSVSAISSAAAVHREASPAAITRDAYLVYTRTVNDEVVGRTAATIEYSVDTRTDQILNIVSGTIVSSSVYKNIINSSVSSYSYNSTRTAVTVYITFTAQSYENGEIGSHTLPFYISLNN